MVKLNLAPIVAAALIAGCSQQAPSGEGSADTNATVQPSGVAREEVAAPTPAPAAPTIAAIQVQPGPKGAQVSLNRVAVTGDVMTVSLSYSGGECCVYTPIEQVSVIDDATSQRISVLKDNAGNWMAAPVYSNNKEVRVDGSEKAPVQIWYKFPAPPATTKTVSITIPEVAPFDGVPVTR